MSINRKLISFLAAGLLILVLPFSADTAKSERRQVNYVALGDSLAAGQTPYHKFDSGYAHYLADRFEEADYLLNFKNFGISGNTSVQLEKDVANNKEVRRKIKQASHITIDIGANDLLGILKSHPDQAASAIDDVSKNLGSILKTIDELNKNVDVYVMGYYNPFPYYPQKQQTALLSLLKTLNEKIKLRTEENGDRYVSTEKVIADQFTEYIPNPMDIHLSPAGYEVVAEEFWKVIASS